MNYYFLETLAHDRQREMLREAEVRRQVAMARARPAGQSAVASRFGALLAIVNAVRTLVIPVRKPRIENSGLGGAS